VLAVLALALVVVPATALGGAARSATNSQNYPDSTGEDPAAPDITSVSVSNDDTGNISFQINISNRPTFTSDMLFQIFLDTDSNPASGDPQSLGADYAIQLEPAGVALFQWNGSTYVIASSQSSVSYTYASTGPTIRVNALDLNKTKAFNFGVIAFSGFTFDANGNVNQANVHADIVPDGGGALLAYKVLTSVTLSVDAFTTSPTPAKAGKPFSAGLAVTESDTSSAVEAGTITCAARIGGRAVPVKTKRLVNGIAVCIWSLPKSARGQTIRGTIAFATQGAQASRAFAAKIS
jgi:hypothetical protein